MKKILMVIFLFSLFGFKHPFYLSVLDLNYNSKEKSMQASVKVFTNDIEQALKNIHEQTVDLINPTNREATNKIIFDYLEKRLKLSVNGTELKYQLLGFEKEQEAIWIYLEVKNCPVPTNLTITNSILYDYIKDQSNIIHAKIREQTKSLKLTNPEKTAVFNFSE